MKFKQYILLLTIFFYGCNPAPHSQDVMAQTIDHSRWSALLQKHVDEKGMVNYQGFSKDEAALDSYLTLLESNSPAESWSKAEQKAYWLNAYNAYTIKLILNHYPLKSIKDIGGLISIPYVNSPWDIKFIEIAEEEYDLNNIEHDILRDELFDPRIHFAIVCASMSCPKLAKEAYQADKLEQQLDNAARQFINDPRRNRIAEENAEVSKIFTWFKGDFTKQGSLVDFLNRYSDIKINKDADIDYMKYDWSLNEQ